MNAATNPSAETRALGEKSAEPSMEEILASIRRIIADEQAASAHVTAPAPVVTVQPLRRDIRAVAEVPAPAVQAVEEFDAWLAKTENRTFALQPAEPAVMQAASAHAAEQTSPGYEEPVQPEAAQAEPLAVPQAHNDAQLSWEAHQAWQEQQNAVAQPDETRALEIAMHAPHLSVVPAEPEQGHASAAVSQQPDDLDMPLRTSLSPESLLSAVAGQSVQSSFQALARTMFMQNTGMVEEAVRDMLRPMLKQWLDDNLPVVVERLVRAEIERVARGGR
jgi:cell pole-organizing protein PopZ